MHGIREDMGRGQVPFKSPQGSKLKRDLLFHDNIRYAKNIIKSLEFKHLTCSIRVFLMWVPLCVITEMFQLIDFKNCMYVPNFFCELGFVEWLSCIKQFHAKEFDLAWKPNIQCDMLDIHVFPKQKYFSSERRTDRANKPIIDKNIMPFVFLTCCICPLVLKLRGTLKNKWQSLQLYNVLTDNNAHWATSEDITLL